MSRSLIVGAIIIGLASLISLVLVWGMELDRVPRFLCTIVLITAILHLLWQTLLSTDSDVEPLDFFPGTVLLFTSLILFSVLDARLVWWHPMSLALLVGLGVLLRPFHVPLDDITEEHEEADSKG